MEGTNARIGQSTRRVLKVVNSTQGNTPNVPDKPRPGEDWIAFGRQNLFPQFVTALVHNFQPILSGVDMMSLYLAGKGVRFVDAQGQPHEAARLKWLELMGEEGEMSFLKAVFKDLVMMGARSYETVWNGAQQPVAIYHLDVTRLRCMPKDEAGVIPSFKWCSDWERLRTNRADVKVVEIPNIAALAGKPKGKTVSYRKNYTPGADYYGWPSWVGALTDLEVGARIPHFNRTQLDTGFRPAFHIHVFTNKDDADVTQLDADVEAIFTGVDGKTYVVTHGTTEEGAPQLNKLERGDHAGELDKIGDRSELIAYKAIGIPPPLMGIDVNTGLGGKALAIEQLVAMFQRTRCVPLQEMITVDALRMVQTCGVAGVAGAHIEQLSPFDPARDPALVRQSYLRSVTVGEDRMANGRPILTTDGKDAQDDRSNWDPRMNLLLIDAGSKGANMNEEEDANNTEPRDA